MNTIEKKAKAYDEAIKKAQDMLSYKELRREDAEYLFPELAESEDEKIRKALIECIEYNVNIAGGFGKQELIAWLEKQGEHYNFRQKIQVGDHVTRNKDGMLVNLSQLNRVAKPCDKKQGEQKPTEWSEGDISHIGYAIDGLERYIKEHPDPEFGNATPCEKAAVRWLKSLKDRCLPQAKTEWSEEDEKLRKEIICRLENHLSKLQHLRMKDEALCKEISWLKSLRPQKQTVVCNEEDIELIEDIIARFRYFMAIGMLNKEQYASWIDKLKALKAIMKPQKQWKPTEEQIAALEWQLNNTDKNSWQYRNTKELYDYLKTL